MLVELLLRKVGVKMSTYAVHYPACILLPTFCASPGASGMLFFLNFFFCCLNFRCEREYQRHHKP